MIFLIDNGHGGIVDGKPVTPGKRSPFDHMGQLIEGESVRKIARLVHKMGTFIGHKVVMLVPEDDDISLDERIKRIEQYAGREAVMISIHHDAFTNDKANGVSAWTTKSDNDSDKLAEMFYQEFEKMMIPEGLAIRTDRGDGDSDFEAGFKIIKGAENANIPAVLLELGFMTHEKNYEYIQSNRGKEMFTKLILNVMQRVADGKLSTTEPRKGLPMFSGEYKTKPKSNGKSKSKK